MYDKDTEKDTNLIQFFSFECHCKQSLTQLPCECQLGLCSGFLASLFYMDNLVTIVKENKTSKLQTNKTKTCHLCSDSGGATQVLFFSLNTHTPHYFVVCETEFINICKTFEKIKWKL